MPPVARREKEPAKAGVESKEEKNRKARRGIGLNARIERDFHLRITQNLPIMLQLIWAFFSF
jgi:hypothetical protein